MANTVPDSQLEFDLGEGEVATDVELPESQQEASSTTEEPAVEAPQSEDKSAHSEELDTVSEAVQKRIAKLTAKMREAERREQAALEYARGVQAQAQQLQERLIVTDQSRMTETKSRLETELATLRAIIRKAREEGDIETETQATERLAETLYEQKQVAQYVSHQEAQRAAPRQEASQPVQQPVQQAAQPQPRAPSPKADSWASRNPWFGQDRPMTYAAWGIHADLMSEGVDPESDEYYTELDNRIRKEFSHRFPSENQRQQRSAPAVAPAARSSGVNSARRSVRLSPSQVAIAKKLGVPLSEYAKYVKD